MSLAISANLLSVSQQSGIKALSEEALIQREDLLSLPERLFLPRPLRKWEPEITWKNLWKLSCLSPAAAFVVDVSRGSERLCEVVVS